MDYEVKNKKENITVLISMTLLLLLVILSLATISRVSIKADTVETISLRKFYLHNGNYNDSEQYVLSMLEGIPELTNNKGSGHIKWSEAHINHISKYFEKENIELDKEKLDEISDAIKGSYEILKYEQKRDINRISIDGRNMIIHLYKNIFKSCGLNITYDIMNNIVRIGDKNGKLIYQKDNEPSYQPIHIVALLLTLTLILILAVICLYIAKKNQIFIKGGIYDGSDEKKYA